ncbi:hypothetical protein CAPTEDRAFT_70103, partial [Capitella teleta]
DINIANQDGYTPLHSACNLENVEMVKMLLVMGAEIDKRDKQGRTALQTALAVSHPSSELTLKRIVEILVAKGANVNVKADRGDTPLHMAADREYLSIAEHLIEQGADPNAVNDEGNTPLHYA